MRRRKDVKSPQQRLIAINPSATDPREFLVTKDEVTIGNGETNDLVLGHGTVSRRHAVLTSQAGVIQIKDLGSTNGTSVNGRRITGPAKIGIGDEIKLGALYASIRFVDQKHTDIQKAAKPIKAFIEMLKHEESPLVPSPRDNHQQDK